MKSFFNTANANPDLKPPPIREGEHSAAPRAAAAGEAPKDPLTMLDQLREKLSYNGREYEGTTIDKWTAARRLLHVCHEDHCEPRFST